MQFKTCCKGNNYEQRFALDTFPADLSRRNIPAKPCILLFTLQQDCNTRKALLLVVKVVFVVFPYSAARHIRWFPYSAGRPIRWFRTQQAAFPAPLHFIAHYRTGSHGSASYRTTGQEKSSNFADENAYRLARDQKSHPPRTSRGRARIPKRTRRRPEGRAKADGPTAAPRRKHMYHH